MFDPKQRTDSPFDLYLGWEFFDHKFREIVRKFRGHPTHISPEFDHKLLFSATIHLIHEVIHLSKTTVATILK